MRSITTIIIFASAILHADDSKLLRAISSVESNHDFKAIGDNGKALGAWQMHAAAWDEANRLIVSRGGPYTPRSKWRDGEAQRRIAEAYMQLIRQRLAKAGVANPTDAQLALCWNCGVRGALDRDLRPSRYSDKVVYILGKTR